MRLATFTIMVEVEDDETIPLDEILQEMEEVVGKRSLYLHDSYHDMED